MHLLQGSYRTRKPRGGYRPCESCGL